MKALFLAGVACLAATAAAAQSACHWGGVVSDASDRVRTLTVLNAQPDGRSSQLFWIDFDGNPVPYAAVPAGASHVQQTFERHFWVVQDSFGNCDGMIMVGDDVEIVLR